MSKKYDAITVGSGLVDAFVLTDTKEVQKKIAFPVGAKIPMKDLIFSSGGGGTNTAVCMSNLGLRVGYLGKIGSGVNSKLILRELKKSKVDFLGVRSNEHTGYSVILATDKKHRTILTYKGVSNKLNFSEINKNKLKTKWFHMTSMQGESFKTQKKLVDFAVKNKIKISYNPGTGHTKKGFKHLRSILAKTDILHLNLEEATLLYGKKCSVKALFKKIKKMGPKIVVITNGEKGGGIYDGTHYYLYKPHNIKVLGNTGAGDAFASTFLTGLIKFKDIRYAIELAIFNAENVIQKIGAKEGLLNLNKLKRLIKSKKCHVKKQLL